MNPTNMPAPPSGLSFQDVSLRFCSVLSGDPSKGLVPWYHFHVLISNGETVGHINFRVGDSEHIRLAVGHIGFGITEPYRGNRYAAQACMALGPFVAEVCGKVLLTANPHNIASIRTIERIGAVFLDEIDVPVRDVHYNEQNRRKRRYAWKPTVPG